MFTGKIVERGGKGWCSIADAARYLRTTQQKVRNMMGAELDYMQMRKNAQPYVAVDDLVKVQIAKLGAKRTASRQ